LANTFAPLPRAEADEFRLPAPGVMVHLSPEFSPPILKGIKVHPDNPFRFDFILDKGDKELSNAQIKGESSKLVKYFLASLTIPEKDLWVNLSPYEKGRIIPQSFGLTEMGRDLLAEDYMLKQITASLIYPDDEVGKKFWNRVYEEAEKKFGTTNIPVNTFNKVWIVPQKAVVYENAKAGTAYVVESRLKVMLEQDYLSMQKHSPSLVKEGVRGSSKDIDTIASKIVREIVIPELTKEVNENKNFARLRQVYNSLILAAWYKKKIKDSILSQVYMDKDKIAGVNSDDPQETKQIYQRYLQAFKKGVFNYIKEEALPGMPGTEQGKFPRKYFSGGLTMDGEALNAAMTTVTSFDSFQRANKLEKVIIDCAMIHETNGNGENKKWKTEDEGVRNVREAIELNKPDLIKNYDRLSFLSPIEVEKLRGDIYRLTQGYLRVWGLSVTSDKRRTTPYFNGSYITALQKVFPALNLDPLGFRLDWSNEQRGIDSVRYVLAKEMPQIIQMYDKFSSLSAIEREKLVDDIYRITQGHFHVWGLDGALTKRVAPYFGGNHGTALQKVFPKLDLDLLGFRLNWSTEERGIASVRYVFSRQIPDIMRRYGKIALLSPEEIIKLRQDIYGISLGNFHVWGIGGAPNQRTAPYFNGSYIAILQKVFSNPLLGFSEEGIRVFRQNNTQIKYHWGNMEEGIENVRHEIELNKHGLIERYDNLSSLSPIEKEKLRQDIYQIKSGDFKVWKLGGGMNKKRVPYFNGSYVIALQKVFPKLDLDPLGFGLDWSSEERGKASVLYVLNKERPEIMEMYGKFNSLSPLEKEKLRSDIYRISYGYFLIWGLSGSINKKMSPYFNGSHIVALQKVFPQLGIDPLGFGLDWSSEESGIASVRFVLANEKTDLIERYDRLNSLSPTEVNNLREDIYKITSSHFKVWELNGAMNPKVAPYFKASYIIALQKVFSKLQLEDSVFRNRSHLVEHPNEAMLITEKNGGIDLTPANMNLQTRNAGEMIKFHMDPAMLEQLKNAPGFIPVIISAQPLKSLPDFLNQT